MTDDTRAEIAALEREIEELVERRIASASGEVPIHGHAREVARAAFRRLLPTHAIVPREMTAGQREVISDLEHDEADRCSAYEWGRQVVEAPTFDSPEDAHAAYIAAGEVKLFGEGG